MKSKHKHRIYSMSSLKHKKRGKERKQKWERDRKKWKQRKTTKKTSAKCVGRYSDSCTEGWIQLKGEFSSQVSVIASICWKHRSVDPPHLLPNNSAHILAGGSHSPTEMECRQISVWSWFDWVSGSFHTEQGADSLLGADTSFHLGCRGPIPYPVLAAQAVPCGKPRQQLSCSLIYM